MTVIHSRLLYGAQAWVDKIIGTRKSEKTPYIGPEMCSSECCQMLSYSVGHGSVGSGQNATEIFVGQSEDAHFRANKIECRIC